VATEGQSRTSLKVLKRSLILFILGVLYYEGIGRGFQNIRILGVLQRLALCYCGAGLAFVWLGSQGDRRYAKLNTSNSCYRSQDYLPTTKPFPFAPGTERR